MRTAVRLSGVDPAQRLRLNGPGLGGIGVRGSGVGLWAVLTVLMVALPACSGDDTDQGALASQEAPAEPDESNVASAGDSDVGDTADGDDSGGTSTPPTTAGSGLPPVTTIPGPAGGDPENIYRGVLGDLDPNDQVAEPVASPPQLPSDVMPLTGLPGVVPDRPAAVVKIDNGPAAGPQTGLNAADIVIEEEVEGGVTRFAAIFHSTASIVGPVRSGRTSDVALVSSLGSPLYMYSGANDITEMIIKRQETIRNRSYSSSSGYWRDETRSAPSNVYTDTAPHWASADGGAPPAQFAYRLNEPDPPTGSEESGGSLTIGEGTPEFAIAYPASPVRWVWEDDSWIRYQRGRRHDLVSGLPVSAANVVVVELDRVATGMVDSAGGEVPESVFVGSGPVTVFSEGQRIQGRWTRPTMASVATLTDNDGNVIELTPGRTWIQLIELGSGALK